ncbi:MAG: adaptor protein MecA [Clostridia bacterium]|nr:adaptor protein MecA [Clostridia bacterium]MCI8980339.1 adaptor protein MecA [Clostridia bacterium]MCI9086298.1 adaptor protein MecA [Clostridia bacterium]
MRIEKLNNDKVVVTLTTADLTTLDIDIKQLSPNSKELHTFLFHIMETIHKETGFNPYSGQVVVEATPSSEGITILVSRLNTAAKKVTREKFNKATRVTAHIKEKKIFNLFFFANFDDLCAALTEMTVEALYDGSLYKLEDSFCFSLKDTAKHKKCAHKMTEFATNNKSFPAHITYVQEHGKLVAEGKELVSLRKNIRNLI